VSGGAALVTAAVPADVETALLALGPSGGVFSGGRALLVVALLFPVDPAPASVNGGARFTG
jgi:hypothetical protein